MIGGPRAELGETSCSPVHYSGNLKTKGVSGAARAQCGRKVGSSVEKGCAGAQRLKSRAEGR